MKDQLNTLNLRSRKEEDENPDPWAEENARFLQEERIRIARNQAETKAMQEEIIAAEKKETGRSVGKVDFIMMMSVAVTADIVVALVALIPYVGWIINWIISPCLFLTFFMWFKIKGIKYNSARKMAALPAGFLIELIPYVNLLPGWTVSVLVNTKGDMVASKLGVK